MDNYYLYLRYKNKMIKFKITNPSANLDELMNNLKTAVDQTGNRIFDLPDMIDYVPTEYFFGKKDETTGKDIVLQPSQGRTKMCLCDYNVKNGDTLEIIPDPIAG